MKPASPELLALLASRQFYRADLYTFTLTSGAVYRFCSGDADITYGGNVYSHGGATGPYFGVEGASPLARWRRGLEVDNLTFDVVAGSYEINGQTFQECLRNGLFDNADLQLDRAYMPTYGNVAAGVIMIFKGLVAEISPIGRTVCTFNIDSYTQKLNMSLPKDLWQPNCANTLGDTACGVNLASFSFSGSADVTSTASIIHATLSQATGYFDFGKITFTSGSNNGYSRGIRSYTNGTPSVVNLLAPFPYTPSAGDTFTIFAGCDKTYPTCHKKFANLDRYRGFPFIPDNTSAV